MYESPIEVIVSDWHKQLIKQQEDQIYQAIISTGVNVDKDELLKALMHDRNQYEKGYMDGARDFAERLKEEIKDTLFAYEAGNQCERVDELLTEMENKHYDR